MIIHLTKQASNDSRKYELTLPHDVGQELCISELKSQGINKSLEHIQI